jgi:hypothetical protein
LSIEGHLRNISQQSLPIGRLEIGEERLYREGHDGKLKMIGTTKTPDELGQGVPLELSRNGERQREKETMLAPRGILRFTISHYMYFPSKYVQHRDNQKDLVVSFHVINILRGGSTREYWTDLVTIQLPSKSHCDGN